MSDVVQNHRMEAAESVTSSASCEEILRKYREGSSKDYDILISHLSHPHIQSAPLVQYLRSLKGCILLLGRHCEALVGVILKIDWLKHDPAVVKEYQSFLVNLVSAHTIYLKATLRMIVKNFSSRHSLAENDTISESARLEDEGRFRNLHSLLKTILQIVPMSPTVLLPLVEELFPYMTKHCYIQSCYVTNLLQIAAYLPAHRPRILELIVDRMTKLDVRSPRSAIAEAEEDEEEEEENEELFEMDEVDMELCERTSQASQDSGNQERTMFHKEANRLDVLMDLMFRYTHSVCHPDGKLDWEATKKLYRELLLVFDRILLPTHDCCHVQFLLFYICSFKEALSEGFIDYLWKKVQDPNTQAVFRQAAVAYMTSLIARGKFIPVSLVKPSLELMVTWAHKYVAQAAYTVTHADLAHHGPFYSVCQAIFYIIAFRHKHLLQTPKGYTFTKNLNLQALVTSRLNPLKWCLPIVASTFASITRMHQLAFCDTILEHNKRAMLPVAGSTEAAGQSAIRNPLDSFFPFDPYLLARSGKYILPLYQEYEGVPPPEETPKHIEEDELYGSEGESVSSMDAEGWLQAAASPPTPAADFMRYGISPGFKTISGS